MKKLGVLLIFAIFLVACNPEELLLEEPVGDEDISYIDIEDIVEGEAVAEEEPEEPPAITGSAIAVDDTEKRRKNQKRMAMNFSERLRIQYFFQIDTLCTLLAKLVWHCSMEKKQM